MFTLIRRLFLGGILLVMAVAAVAPLAAQQDDLSPPDTLCDDVRFLMARQATPYDLQLGGGPLLADETVFGTVSGEYYADFWSFEAARPRDEFDNALAFPVTFTFEEVRGDLEFALYKGMIALTDFVPLATTQINIERDGIYTVVIRRATITDTTDASYTLQASHSTGGTLGAPGEFELDNNDPILRDPPPTTFDMGLQQIDMETARILAHAGAIRTVNTRSSASTQVFFPNRAESSLSLFTAHIGGWASDVRFLAGDMALRGSGRIYYLQGYGYNTTIDGINEAQLNFLDITYGDNTRVQMSWEAVQGVWVMDDCVGIRLDDARTFVSPIATSERVVDFSGPLEAFEINLQTPDNPYTALLDWRNVRPGAELSYRDGAFDIPLLDDRQLTLQTNELTMTGQPTDSGDVGRTDVRLEDRELSLSLDWVNMRALHVLASTFEIDFTDEPRASLDFSRSTDNLIAITSIDDVIRLQYAGPDNITIGEERVLLPSAQSYIEIVTPAGDPPFDGRALPGEEGYAPRALNNTGSECYRANTLLPEANCPPNGEVNPANGNLFYSVTDLQAYGGDNLDLLLTRSYNSQLAHLDGPFGRGWSSPYPLDYAVPFDETTLSRVVAPGNAFPAGLDVTYAPRGIVTFTTASGSRHQFTVNAPAFEGGELQAISMPGWTLSIPSLFDDTWTLTQVDGYTYTFDRAGRLLGYQTANGSRRVTIRYAGNSVTAIGGSDEQVIITDSEEPTRELRLAYNAEGRITSATLTDRTGELADQQTTYTYDGDRLVSVTYPDGSVATYSYDDAGRMLEHIDPRAPVVPHMTYTYDQNGRVGAVSVMQGDEATLYRQYTTTSDEVQLITTVTDDLNNRQSYTYRYTLGNLRQVDNTFTLAQVSSPLADIETFEEAPQVYLWEDGLLTRLDTRQLAPGQGRSATSISYNQFGQVDCIACVSRALPQLEVIYAEDPETGETLPYPAAVTYASGAQERYTYDPDGRIQTHTDIFDSLYTYTWDDTRLVNITREQDGASWDYTYNTTGQVTQIAESRGGEPHTLQYRYDALGRVISMADSTLGTYTFSYETVEDNGLLLPQVTITDPIGAVAVVRYDALGRVVERSLEDAEGLLSLTTYAYDLFGRLTEQATWLVDDERGVPQVTTYDYQRRPTIPPLRSDESGTVINGREVIMTRPDGGVYRYAFDAIGRLRRLEDANQKRTYYDYFVNDTSGYQWGLRVEERSLLSGSADIDTVRYLFDGKRQLREVLDDRRRWVVNLDGDSSRVSGIIPQVENAAITLQGVFFDDYTGGQPNQMEVRQADLFLNSGFSVLNQHRPFRAYTYDVDGNLASFSGEDENPYHTLHCPQGGGAVRVIYTRNEPICNSEDFELALTYDSAGRLTGADDTNGVRVFLYTPDPDTNTWRVDATFTGEGGTSTWAFVYNAAGQIVKWTNADGFRRNYTYDTLGRLVRVTTGQNPEDSLNFRYDVRGNLVEQTDDLGRGFLYNYNDQGHVISRLDTFTADTTSYAYTPDGQLETVISPQGSTTTYVYEDDADPTRLTGLIEPTGSQHRFEWLDSNNTLVYTDPLGAQSQYRYDGNGLLWRIEDAVVVRGFGNRNFEVHYNDNGEIIAWLRDARPGNTRSRLEITQAEPGQYTIIEQETGWSTSFSLSPTGVLRALDGISANHDALDRLTNLSANDEQVWRLSWSDADPQLTLQDPFGGETQFRYDSMYRLLTEQREDGTLAFDYTAGLDGQVIIDVAYPDTTTEQFVIDPGDARASNPRTISRVGPGGQVVYVYNNEGLLSEIRTERCSDPNVVDVSSCAIRSTSQRFEYDTVGRPLRVTDGDGNFEAFTYDEAGKLLTYQTANGRRFNYHYDDAGRLAHITSPTGIKMIMTRNPMGDVTGICRNRVEDPDTYSECVAGGGELVTYTYDVLGRRTSRQIPLLEDSVVNIAYTYNEQGAVASAQRGDFTVGYLYNALGQLAGIESEGGQVSFTYANLDQIAVAGGDSYRYDARGRLVAAGALQYAYNSDRTEIYDGETLAMQYGLDPRGILTSLGDDRITFDYPTQRRQTLNRADGVQMDMVTTALREVQSITYEGGGNFAVFHEADPAGYIRRQTISRPVDGLGYGLVLGYDNDDRPLTMRVTDNTGLQVLYTQTFTYDKLGNPQREIRQFGDGTQMIIRYTYQNLNQLVRQSVTIVRPQAQAALSASAVLALALVIWSWARRRNPRYVLVGLGTLLIVAASAPLMRVQQQQGDETYTLEYRYTSFGAVDSVVAASDGDAATRVECVRYDYDGLNRLTRTRYLDSSGEDASVTYAYDSFNRLVTAGEWELRYNGDTLFAVSDGEETYYYGGAQNHPGHYTVSQTGIVTWLVNDGRDRIVQPVPEDSDPQPDLWLFDPMRRYLGLAPPLSDVNPCRLTGSPGEFPPHLTVQPLDNGMIWDTRTNLYFDQGRAYEPESGRFLQPDPHGPDALGKVYTAHRGRTELPITPNTEPYYQGLYVLEQATQQLRLNDHLTADAVRARYQPAAPGGLHTLAADQSAARQPYTGSLANLEGLPVWLRTAYNLPAPDVHPQTGAIRMPQGATPAQRVTTSPGAIAPPNLPAWDIVLVAGVRPNSMAFSQLGQGTPQVPTSYIPGRWAANVTRLETATTEPSVQAVTMTGPGAVLPWLPKPLENPAAAIHTLDYVHALIDMPHRTPAGHARDLLGAALPQPYTLPDQDPTQHFIYDLFGIKDDHARPPLPSAPSPVLPGVTVSAD